MAPLSSACLFSTLLIFSLLSSIHANLMAVDLGLGYIKVAVARPGKGLELVTNELSKRKTPAAVAFTEEGERLFGDAAVAYAAKAPHRVILDGRSLIARCAADAPHTPLCPRHRHQLQGVGQFTGEEVIAMQLAMARRQASTFLGGAAVKDLAVTVPAWYDERQRMAVADAARVIGMNCLGVVNANTAAALKYALDGKARPTEGAIAAAKGKDRKKRSPKSLSQKVLFYDIGAGSASASVAEVASDVKSGVASSVKVLGHAWEMGISGRELDHVIVNRLADSFDKQRGNSATPSRQIPRVMMRLRKEAQRAKEVLSANMDAMVSVPSLYDDLDLRTTLHRSDFEADAKSMFRLVKNPVKTALEMAKISASELDAVVPFGGVSRTPKVQEEICNALGVDTLNKSINTDEAAVMGSVFFAASLSSTFRVRKMDFEDVFTRGVSVEIEKESKSGGLFSPGKGKSIQKVDLFKEGVAKMPSKKTLSLNRQNDFDMEVYLEVDKSGKARFLERSLYSKISIKGVSEVLKKLKDPSKAKKVIPRVALTFHIDRSGGIRIGTAESSVDETIIVEREVEVVAEKKNSTAGDADKKTKESTSKDGDSKEKENENKGKYSKEDVKENEEGKNNRTEEKQSKQKEKKKTRMEKSTQTIVHRHGLTIEYGKDEGIVGMQMSGKELEAAQKVLKDLENADLERVERADALNALEGFLLEIRSKVKGLEEDENLYKVSTEEEREKLIAAFDEGEDWMYTEAAKQTASLRLKQHELRKMYEPMERRAMELERRPEGFKAILKGANLGIEQSSLLQKLHVERGSKHVGEFDEFQEYCKSLIKWVDEMEKAQAEKSLTEEPVVTVKEISVKAMELKTKVEKLAKLELPPAPAKEEEKVEKTEEIVDEGVNSTSKDGLESKGSEQGEGSVASDVDVETAKADAVSAGATKDEL